MIIFLSIFKTLSFSNHKSKGAYIFRECSPPTMCHMSHCLFVDEIAELVRGGAYSLSTTVSEGIPYEVLGILLQTGEC